MAAFALINGDQVTELFSSNPGLHSDMDVVDVSTVPGIAVGWFRQSDGSFAATIPTVALTEPAREDYVKQLQSSAEGARNAYITAGAGKTQEYLLKLDEAVAVLADGTPTNSEYPLLASMIGIEYNLSNQLIATVLEAGAVVRDRNASMKSAFAAIAVLYTNARETIRTSTTEQQARDALNVSWPAPA